MAGKTKEARIEALENKLNVLKSQKQKPRLQVAVAPATKLALAPICHGRTAGPIIVAEAEKLTLNQALKLLATEDNTPYGKGPNGERIPSPTIVVTPTPVLLERAQRWYIGPHLLVRAAAVKIANHIKWSAERGKDDEYLAQIHGNAFDSADGVEEEEAFV